MVVCWDCGMKLKSREDDGVLQVYDADLKCWIEECPNCGSIDFADEDEIEENYYNDNDDY
jgi:predicted  nucleic acid-binding Zn-ribbon protein